ncbi:hypothetical protein BGZ76_002270 [Entomortierella beljakovae]|nr:hypothetical protein BGZ76_002270 [Entomortierella beljakovae]
MPPERRARVRRQRELQCVKADQEKEREEWQKWIDLDDIVDNDQEQADLKLALALSISNSSSRDSRN